jgi:hypothetical protein
MQSSWDEKTKWENTRLSNGLIRKLAFEKLIGLVTENIKRNKSYNTACQCLLIVWQDVLCGMSLEDEQRGLNYFNYALSSSEILITGVFKGPYFLWNGIRSDRGLTQNGIPASALETKKNCDKTQDNHWTYKTLNEFSLSHVHYCLRQPSLCTSSSSSPPVALQSL